MEITGELIGKTLKEIRQQAGLKQVEVAIEMNAPQTSVNRIEKGKHLPTLETIFKYADACGYEVLIGFKKQKTLLDLMESEKQFLLTNCYERNKSDDR